MTSVVRSVVTCQADADVSFALPLPPRFLLYIYIYIYIISLSLSHPFFSPYSPSPSPPPSSPSDAARGRNPIRAVPHPPASILARQVPSRFNPRVDSLLHPSPRSSHPPCPFPRRDFLPSSAPTLTRILLIVPASILNPLSFHLALFSGCANGVISAPFSRSVSDSSPRVTSTRTASRPFAER